MGGSAWITSAEKSVKLRAMVRRPGLDSGSADGREPELGHVLAIAPGYVCESEPGEGWMYPDGSFRSIGSPSACARFCPSPVVPGSRRQRRPSSIVTDPENEQLPAQPLPLRLGGRAQGAGQVGTFGSGGALLVDGRLPGFPWISFERGRLGFSPRRRASCSSCAASLSGSPWPLQRMRTHRRLHRPEMGHHGPALALVDRHPRNAAHTGTADHGASRRGSFPRLPSAARPFLRDPLPPERVEHRPVLPHSRCRPVPSLPALHDDVAVSGSSSTAPPSGRRLRRHQRGAGAANGISTVSLVLDELRIARSPGPPASWSGAGRSGPGGRAARRRPDPVPAPVVVRALGPAVQVGSYWRW